MADPGKDDILQELIGYLSVEGALLYNTRKNKKMGDGMVKGLPLCTVYSYSNASFNEENLQDILNRLNNDSVEN